MRLLLNDRTRYKNTSSVISNLTVIRKTDVKNSIRLGPILCLLLVMLTASCSPIKNLEVWKDEAYTKQPKKILLLVLTRRENIRRQSENVLSNHLAKKGVVAIAGHKVLPNPGETPDREVIKAKVRELGVDSVLVAHSIGQKEITNHQYGGVVLGGVAVYDGEGWYGYGYGYSYNREYDSDLFIISTKLYDVDGKKPVWSYLSQIKVDGSRERAVNMLIPTIVEKMEESQLLQ